MPRIPVMVQCLLWGAGCGLGSGRRTGAEDFGGKSARWRRSSASRRWTSGSDHNARNSGSLWMRPATDESDSRRTMNSTAKRLSSVISPAGAAVPGMSIGAARSPPAPDALPAGSAVPDDK